MCELYVFSWLSDWHDEMGLAGNLVTIRASTNCLMKTRQCAVDLVTREHNPSGTLTTVE